VTGRTIRGPRPIPRGLHGDGAGARRLHLSPGARAALARTRLIEVVPAGPSRLHSSAPPRADEPPVVLHPLWAPVHARRGDGTDTRTPVRRVHALHPSTPPRRGLRPGRRPRPVAPFDIPVEAFAVEIGGGAHPSVRSLGARRHVYIEHRHAVRRAYRRRQLVFAAGLSGAFVVVAAAALAPGSHADATVTGNTEVAAAPVHTVRSQPRAAIRSAGRAVPVRPALVLAPRAASLRTAPVSTTPGPRSGPSGPDGSFWRAQRGAPPSVTTTSAVELAEDPFLVCTRGFESIYAGGYGAISPDGHYFGAYQFDLPTWNGTARHLRRFDLVGVRPDFARPADQDLMAFTLYEWQGASHWNYRCAGLP
jgi:hypothetical protein